MDNAAKLVVMELEPPADNKVEFRTASRLCPIRLTPCVKLSADATPVPTIVEPLTTKALCDVTPTGPRKLSGYSVEIFVRLTVHWLPREMFTAPATSRPYVQHADAFRRSTRSKSSVLIESTTTDEEKLIRIADLPAKTAMRWKRRELPLTTETGPPKEIGVPGGTVTLTSWVVKNDPSAIDKTPDDTSTGTVNPVLTIITLEIEKDDPPPSVKFRRCKTDAIDDNAVDVKKFVRVIRMDDEDTKLPLNMSTLLVKVQPSIVTETAAPVGALRYKVDERIDVSVMEIETGADSRGSDIISDKSKLTVALCNEAEAMMTVLQFFVALNQYDPVTFVPL